VASALTAPHPRDHKTNRPLGESARADSSQLLSTLDNDVAINLAPHGEPVAASTDTESTTMGWLGE
jgi:hypothetical protein